MKLIYFGACVLALVLGGNGARAGGVLIRPEEAALPPAPNAAGGLTRGLTRRPDVALTSPEAGMASPFNLQFKFQAHGGSTIKPNSFHLIYLKSPNVDLTARVKPYVTKEGVEMIGAQAPPGRHMIKVMISDNSDREASAVFVLDVIK
jgi:hypothetical protein